MSEDNKFLLKLFAVFFICIFIIFAFKKYQKECTYKELKTNIESKNWVEAKSKLDELGSYKDSKLLSDEVNFNYYVTVGDKKYSEKDYKTALDFYQKASKIQNDNNVLENKLKGIEVIASRQELMEEFNKRQQEQDRIKKEEKQKLATIKNKIDKDAIQPIPTSYGKGYDKTIKRYGIANIKKINVLMPKAAALIAENPRCQKVLYVDVSDEKSTKNSIVMYVDCGDMGNFSSFERFYVSEKDINAKKQPTNLKEQMEQNKSLYLQACKAEIKSRLTHPSTFKSNSLLEQGVLVNSFQTVINIDFKAKNSLNLEIPYKGMCRYNAKNELVEFSIKEK